MEKGNMEEKLFTSQTHIQQNWLGNGLEQIKVIHHRALINLLNAFLQDVFVSSFNFSPA